MSICIDYSNERILEFVGLTSQWRFLSKKVRCIQRKAKDNICFSSKGSLWPILKILSVWEIWFQYFLLSYGRRNGFSPKWTSGGIYYCLKIQFHLIAVHTYVPLPLRLLVVVDAIRINACWSASWNKIIRSSLARIQLIHWNFLNPSLIPSSSGFNFFKSGL